jgi:hypothetical protein
LAGGIALGQTATEALRPAWRKVGSSSVDLMLAAPATGPVDSVWFAPDGRTLYARTHSGKTFETADFENWAPSTASRPDSARAVTAERLPAPNAVLRPSQADSRRLYALANQVYESEDGGRTWTNLSAYKN